VPTVTDTPDEPLPKPDELLALDAVAEEMFETLRRWFDVPPSVALDLRAVDSAVVELGEPVMIAAVAMRKLQALHLLATPGVRTTTDVVVTIVQDLDRALVQAPTMRLQVAAETTDWDAALAEIDTGPAPADASEEDEDADRFRELHGLLHRAAIAVVDASEGAIRHFI
jgi:hypothetical protein